MKKRKDHSHPVKKKKGKWIIGIMIFLIIGVMSSILFPAQDEKKEEKISIGVRQPVEFKNATYIVNNVEKTSRISQGSIYTDAEEIYIIIGISITNNRNDAMSVNYTDFKLKNGEKTYSPNVGAANFMVDGSQTIFNGINPDSTMDGKIIFDINEEASNSVDLVLSIDNRQDIYLNK